MESMRRTYKITLEEEDALVHLVCDQMKAMAELRMEEKIREEFGRVISRETVTLEDTLDFRYSISMNFGSLLMELSKLRRKAKKGKKK
jgi:hypothetical protein